jgi:hypothetical protein
MGGKQMSEASMYVDAAIKLLEKGDFDNAEKALIHVNHILDGQEAK